MASGSCATDAAIVHEKDPKSYLANISPSNASATIGLFWQAGAKPFSYDGKKTVSVDLTSPDMVKVAEYWQKLVQAGTVSTDPDFRPVVPGPRERQVRVVGVCRVGPALPAGNRR